jgi:drug/metabolite transporter (DMT)-like permease
MLRFVIALIFLYIIKLKFAPNERLNAKDIPLLFAAGITGVTLYFFFENNGISLVSASEASIAISSIPVLILITGWILEKVNNLKKKHLTQENTGREKSEPSTIKKWQWVGCFVSIAGVWLVAGVSFAVSGSMLGYVYMSGAALSWVAYSFFTRALFKHHSVIFIVFWQSLAGFICFIPFSVVELKNWGNPTTEIIFHLLFLAILCTAIGHWFYVIALESLSVTISGIFLNLIPVVTVIGGFIVLGERLRPLQWLGALFVVFGVTLAMWRGKNENVQ